jgi:hypothetical protein
MLTALPSVASAQPEKGDKEILLFGQLMAINSDGSTVSIGNIFANLGVFVTDTFEVGGGPTITIANAGGGTDTTLGLNGFVRLNFATGNPRLVPYVGGEVFIQDVNPDFGSAGDTTFANAIGGVKNYFSENAALDIKGQFGFLLTDPGAVRMFGFTVGLTVIF